MNNLSTFTVSVDGKLVPFNDATLHIASSAVLYGLSVYTVFSVNASSQGMVAFRLEDHYRRLVESAHIIGIDEFIQHSTFQKFNEAVRQLISSNKIKDDVFVRATVHVADILPGTKSRGLHTQLTMFLYPSVSILPEKGARLKTSTWRRVQDNAIPARAKVNGAYVNSVLGKQDAIDSGYDDCVFLDSVGHVCELSAANIFLVKKGSLITPDSTSDLLEGINRRTIIEYAKDLGLTIEERTVDLTELYVADELFACGTSAYITPILEVDARKIGNGLQGPLTKKLAKVHFDTLHGNSQRYQKYLTNVYSL